MSILAKVANVLARRTFLSAIARLKVGKLTIEMPDGSVKTFDSGEEGPFGVLQVKGDDFFGKVIFHGEIGFGEAYQAQLCGSPDLVALIRLAILNRRAVDLNQGALRLLSKRKNIHLHRGNRNTVEQSKHNIHDHYDLGNDFFRLFLDDTLTYSSAVFETPEQDLADAQRNKYRCIAEGAQITGTDHVLEIGTGWGGFAIFAARTYGCRVTSLTISKEQFNFAVERIAEAGLTELIDVQMLDYREATGSYDKIVSIEMFEAVGAEYFETFFLKCDDVLKPGGFLSMQVITVPDEDYDAQLNGANWIQKYIFPGGILPSVKEMERCNEHTNLTISSVDDVGEHYAATLHQWRNRFWQHIGEVKEQGFDDHFIQTWDYYLAVCEAGFITRNTGDAQVVFVKAT